jgi:CBS domain-containing protein
MILLVRDVMTAEVITVAQDAPFVDIATALRRHHVSAFPVLNAAGEVIGVVSESDLLAKLALSGGEDGEPGFITGILHQHQAEKARAVTAGELMTAPPVTVSPDDTVEHAAQLMYKRQVKRLPVTDDARHLAGIISRTDVLAVYGRPDHEIGEEIRRDILQTEEPAAPGTFDVSVTAGVVTLAGAPRTVGQANHIVARVRHVQGVVAVRDRLDRPPAEPDPYDVLARFSAD